MREACQLSSVRDRALLYLNKMIETKLSEDIRDHVFDKLDEIYNHRKEKEGLVSLHNILIIGLRRTINNWVAEHKLNDKKIDILVCHEGQGMETRLEDEKKRVSECMKAIREAGKRFDKTFLEIMRGLR